MPIISFSGKCSAEVFKKFLRFQFFERIKKTLDDLLSLFLVTALKHGQLLLGNRGSYFHEHIDETPPHPLSSVKGNSPFFFTLLFLLHSESQFHHFGYGIFRDSVIPAILGINPVRQFLLPLA